MASGLCGARPTCVDEMLGAMACPVRRDRRGRRRYTAPARTLILRCQQRPWQRTLINTPQSMSIRCLDTDFAPAINNRA